MKLLQRLQIEAPMLSGAALELLIGQVLAAASAPQILAAEHPAIKRIRQDMQPQMTIRQDGIAVIPVEGILARSPDIYELLNGVEDSAKILEMVEAASTNPDISGILLNIDSPGGFITGGVEIADAVAAAGKSKPVVAWSGGTMASMAYYIGSQADQVLSSRSAQVGSIGTYAAYVDVSRLREQMGIKVEIIKNKEAAFKAAGAYGTPLTDAQRENIQAGVQSSFNDFKKAVTSKRPQVADDAMRGQVFSGSEAKKAGLIDRFGDFSLATSALRQLIRQRV